MIRPIRWALVALPLVALFGCSEPVDEHAHDADAKPKNVEPRVKKLQISDVKVGAGEPLANGDLALVTYVGAFGNRDVFDSNDKADSEPYGFFVGTKGVIPGWDQGVVGMKIGGVRKLAIPPELGYGKTGFPPNIPPDTDLYFTITLLDVVKKGEENKLVIEDIKLGSGPEAKEGDTVLVQNTTELVNGRLIDSSYKKNKPVEFKIGSKFVLAGINAGIVGMKPGGKRRLRLPPNIAWGVAGGPSVPANSVIIVDLELVEIKKRA